MIENGNDIMDFLEAFEFWDVSKSSTGKYGIVLKDAKGEYIRVWSRKNETLVAMFERLRRKVDERNKG